MFVEEEFELEEKHHEVEAQEQEEGWKLRGKAASLSLSPSSSSSSSSSLWFPSETENFNESEKREITKEEDEKLKKTKRNERFECPICYEERGTEERHELRGCGHSFCAECLKKYLLRAASDLTPPCCPTHMCRILLLELDLSDLLPSALPLFSSLVCFSFSSLFLLFFPLLFLLTIFFFIFLIFI